MRNKCISNKISSLAGAAMLAVIALAPISAGAVSLGAIPESGAPAFIFNDSVTTAGGGKGFAADIRSWFENYSVARTDSGSISLNAHNEGDFIFRGTLTNDYADVTDYSGTNGVFDLQALLDQNSNSASGSVKITGAVAALGIYNPNSVLMTANVIGYEQSGGLIGLAIDNIICHAAIKFCATSATQVESVYLELNASLDGLNSANGFNFRANITSTTTVPVPAAAWLMLSGLGWMGLMARRRKA